MLSEEPDLLAELELADGIVTGRIEDVRTEWGVRRDDGVTVPCASEYLARLNAAGKNGIPASMTGGTVVQRTVICKPWEEAPGGH